MRTKYPRTFHLPWSEGQSDDDKTLSLRDVKEMFEGKEVVVTEKLDGENTTIYWDGFTHARSLSSGYHPSRTYVKQVAARIIDSLPEGWRIVGENLYAKHSIGYRELPDFFMLFGIIDDKNRNFEWRELEVWAEILDIPLAPVIWKGTWDLKAIQGLYPFPSKAGGDVAEGYVVRNAGEFSMDDFGNNIAKFVRKNHVQTDQHWAHSQVVPNKKKLRV